MSQSRDMSTHEMIGPLPSLCCFVLADGDEEKGQCKLLVMVLGFGLLLAAVASFFRHLPLADSIRDSTSQSGVNSEDS